MLFLSWGNVNPGRCQEAAAVGTGLTSVCVCVVCVLCVCVIAKTGGGACLSIALAVPL